MKRPSRGEPVFSPLPDQPDGPTRRHPGSRQVRLQPVTSRTDSIIRKALLVGGVGDDASRRILTLKISGTRIFRQHA
jgi:hypothetical protein